MIHTAVYAALAGLGLVFLSLRVIAIRRRERISVGHRDNPSLKRAMRVQANFAEYAPLALLLLGLSESLGLTPVAIHGLGICLVMGRVAHFLGFRSPEAPGVLRVGGMALTFGVLILLSAILLVQVAKAGSGPASAS